MSVHVTPWLAVFGVDLPKQNRSVGKVPGLLLSDMALIVGVGVGLVLLLALAIYLSMRFRRNRRRHVSGGEKVFRKGTLTSEEKEEVASSGESEEETDSSDHRHGRRRYKYRVRRRGHRSRNPTLSETGGLPPVKSEEPT